MNSLGWFTEAQAGFDEKALELMDVNPELLLHHMQDPCQDRLMVREMAYLRAKWLRLGPTYQQFLRDTLQPGGTIFLSECQLSWPTLQAGDRYVFQYGGVGGIETREYFDGGPRVVLVL